MAHIACEWEIEVTMRLSERSYGCRKLQDINLTVDMHPFCHKVDKERPSTVDALERNPSGRRTIIRNDVTSGSVRATQGGAVVQQRTNAPVATKSTNRRSSKGRIKSSTVAVYAGVFALFVAVIAVGYRTPQEDATASSATPVSDVSESSASAPAINEVVASDIAASVAQTAKLAVAPNAAQRAVSAKMEASYVSADNSTVVKPAIVAVESTNRDVIKYTVLDGDTATSVAQHFGITAQTLKWANDLKDDKLIPGTELKVLPRDGVLYTMKDGDTIESVAKKYKGEASLITSYNDLELEGAKTGQSIIIPNGILPETERPGYTAPAPAVTSTGGNGRSWGFRAGSVGNKYAFGNCTFYAYERRAQLGRPVGSFWGDAKTWGIAASAQGYRVDGTPAAGAVLVDTAGYYGHVAIVEKVLPNGNVFISEMNNYAYGGFNIVSTRTLTPGQAALYQYIH